MDLKNKGSKKEKTKDWWKAIVFCLNCLEVNDILILREVLLEEAQCVNCGVVGMMKFVRKINTYGS